MGVAFGSGLELTIFRVQKRSSSGGFSSVSTLEQNKKYRFWLRFKDVANYPNHSHLETKSVQLKDDSYCFYYSSAGYTGTESKKGTDKELRQIYPGKTLSYFFHFIWKPPNDTRMPPPAVQITVDLCSVDKKGKLVQTLVPLIS